MTQPTPQTDPAPPDIMKALALVGALGPTPTVPARPDSRAIDLSHLAGQIAVAKLLVDKMAELKRELEPLRDAIKAAMGDAEVALVNGQPVATYRTHKQTRLVPQMVRDLDPATAAACTVPVLQRQFLWVEPGQEQT